MKKIKLLLLLLFLSTAFVVAQQKKYVSYTVKKRETLKSIAKEYNISTRDLIKLNPGVSRKPKAKTVIIVPNKNYGRSNVDVIVAGDTYKVKPKETLFGISQKFGVTIEALKTVNANLEGGLKTGMLLTIPEPTITVPKDSLNFVLHSVIIDDTVFNLSKKYNVTEEEIFLLNPILKDGLKLGMLLKIKPVSEAELDATETAEFVENIDFSKEINVALMLPYQLNKLTDSIVNESFQKKNSLLNIATDFHLGTAMAIDSLRSKGLRVNVRYFDTENSNYKLQYIVNKNNFSTTDVVIGPLFYDKALWVSKHIDAPVVAPLFSKKQANNTNKNLIKSSPDTELYEEKLVNYLEEKYTNQNIVIITDEKEESKSKLWRIVTKIKAFDSIQNVSVVKPESGLIDSEKFIEKLDSMGNNWVVNISDEIVTTSAAINNLKSPVERMNVQLFTLTKGRNFENIDNQILGKLNLVYPTTDYLNLEDKKVVYFYDSFKRKNATYPSKYAIRGFDVVFDALVRIASSDNFDDGLKAGFSTRVVSIFDFEKKLFGSFVNKGLVLVKYNSDLTTVILE